MFIYRFNGIMSNPTNSRPEHTPPDIEKRELEWWQKFTELELRFSWVQTPAIQKILRGKYVRQIVKYAGRNGRILELGCGTGWLCFVLAESGAKEVCGVDFSPDQIAIAQSRAEAQGLANRVHFRCADGTQNNGLNELFDCVVAHAFLHHLNKAEISRTIASVPGLLKPNGTFILYEPVFHTSKAGTPMPLKLKWYYILSQLAYRGQRFGIRHISQEEKYWRDLLAQRNWGIPPHGPSPKEMPFAPGELEDFLTPHFVIERQLACMTNSHCVMQEWLLRELSHPILTRWLLPWVARAAAWIDRELLKQNETLPNTWIFNMWICRPRVFHE
jgi:2-polyprenyl-3-methyl-5-hydroxy-6-metoxy-1,4-benzoquinol methylase